jgi:hypothetical protein
MNPKETLNSFESLASCTAVRKSLAARLGFKYMLSAIRSQVLARLGFDSNQTSTRRSAPVRVKIGPTAIYTTQPEMYAYVRAYSLHTFVSFRLGELR